MQASAIREAICRFVPDNKMDSYLIKAAVFIILFHLNGELFVILNRRSNSVGTHKGEICFPGGKMEKDDPDLMHTALRELREEMGILPGEIEVFGSISSVQTNTGFDITPFVGYISYPYHCEINKDEVESVIEFPINRVFDENFERSPAYESEYPVFEYNTHVVFGATARILSDFYDLIIETRLN